MSILLVAIDVGERTQAMAHRFVHHVAQVLAPDGAPLFLTDGLREYATASDPLQKDAEEAIFDQQPADRTPGCKRR